MSDKLQPVSRPSDGPKLKIGDQFTVPHDPNGDWTYLVAGIAEDGSYQLVATHADGRHTKLHEECAK